MTERETGNVKWFDASKGYGFISRKQDSDIFVHSSAINGDRYRALKEGQEVEFTVTRGKKGLQAQDVTVLKDEINP